MHSLCGNHKHHARRQRRLALVAPIVDVYAHPLTPYDSTDTGARVGVLRLHDAPGKVQVIQAGVPTHRGGQQKRIRAPVDVGQPPARFQRASHKEDAYMLARDNQEACAARDMRATRRHKIHAAT